MKKVNLLSKAEMRKVMGGVAAGGVGPCLEECTVDGNSCKLANKTGKCTFYAASPDCPDGQYACIVSEA